MTVCDVDGGDRCYARVVEPEVLGAMESEEWTGRQVTLRSVDNVNVVAE